MTLHDLDRLAVLVELTSVCVEPPLVALLSTLSKLLDFFFGIEKTKRYSKKWDAYIYRKK